MLGNLASIAPSKVDEYGRKLPILGKGRIGYKHSVETRLKISNSHKGKIKTEAHRKNISIAAKERFKDKTNHPSYGMKFSEERKEHMRQVNLGERNHNFGKPICDNLRKAIIAKNKRGCSIEQRKKIRNTIKTKGCCKNENNPNWKGGKSSLVSQIRRNDNYVLWRTEVFKRDNYVCKTCNDASGHNLCAHHIIRLKDIIFMYNIVSIIDIEKYDILWDVDNGITLCDRCHRLIHRRK